MGAQDDSRVKPHVRAAAQEVVQKFGITNIGGFASTGHIPNSDHYRGLALDVMTSLKGQEVANYFQANATRLAVTYIIWNRRIWDSRNNKGWVPYSGTSPHTDHVHISFKPEPGPGGPVVDGQSPSGTEPQGCLKLLLDLLNPTKW